MSTGRNHARVAIVGTGFSGLGAAITFQRAGIDYVVFERRPDLGGTWLDNSYPGCRCDVPSHLYSYSFAPNPEWSHTYSPQPEIWAYLRRTATAAGVVPQIRFEHEVLDTHWDDDTARWVVETSGGRWTADIVILGNGALSEPSIPSIPGLESFEGTVFHSAEWRHDHDLAGERVAVIGTGASSIQFIPEIQPDVASMHVFQRTPAWVLPHRDRPITDIEHTLYRHVPFTQRIAREFVYWTRELIAIGLTKRPKMVNGIEKLGRAHLAKQVRDPDLRRQLTPDFSPGCKRLLLSNDYYPALQQPNVAMVTEGIRELRPHSIVTEDGTEREVDTIIFGTGFRVTDFPLANRVRGTDGHSLADVWDKGGAKAYLGTTVPGFPNLFVMTGPNTGIGHTSLVVMIEAQLRYIMDAIKTLDRRDAAAVEVEPAACERYNEQLQEKMSRTVWSLGGCRSWYMDAKGRNVTLWPDFTWRFRQMTRRFDSTSYRFIERPSQKPVPISAESSESPLVTVGKE